MRQNSEENLLSEQFFEQSDYNPEKRFFSKTLYSNTIFDDVSQKTCAFFYPHQKISIIQQLCYGDQDNLLRDYGNYFIVNDGVNKKFYAFKVATNKTFSLSHDQSLAYDTVSALNQNQQYQALVEKVVSNLLNFTTNPDDLAVKYFLEKITFDQANHQISLNPSIPTLSIREASAPDISELTLQPKQVPMINKYLLTNVPFSSKVPYQDELFIAKANQLGFIGPERSKFINALKNITNIPQSSAASIENFSHDDITDQQRTEILFDFIISTYNAKYGQAATQNCSTSCNTADNEIKIKISDDNFFEITFKVYEIDYKIQLHCDSLKYFENNGTEIPNQGAFKRVLNEALKHNLKQNLQAPPSPSRSTLHGNLTEIDRHNAAKR